MSPRRFGFALLAALAAGIGIGRLLPRGDASTGATAATVAATPAAAATPGPVRVPQAPSFATAPVAARGSEDLDRAIRRAAQDPAHLRELLREYAFAADLDRRGALLAVLQGVANDEVLQAGRRLAGDADPAVRDQGYALLRAFPLDRAEARAAIADGLQRETDPALLAQLLGGLEPAVLADEDAAPLLERAVALTGHTDPAVRAGAVLQSARWNRSGDSAALLERALLDPAADVRAAAVAGIEASGARTPRLRDALLDLAGDARIATEQRRAALFALQRFALDRADYALYRQAEAGIAAAEAERDAAAMPH